jgi:hypothetical protein
MDLWYPPKDRPQLLEWWRPLILASKAARAMGSPWPIHVDEHILRGRVDRSSRPAIWVYVCPATGGELYLDATGRPYRFRRTPNATSLGRFTECDLLQAIWAAGLPRLQEEQDGRAAHPTARRGPAAELAGMGDAELTYALHQDDLSAERRQPTADVPASPAEGEPRRRGHLLVYEGGRPLAG